MLLVGVAGVRAAEANFYFNSSIHSQHIVKNSHYAPCRQINATNRQTQNPQVL